MGSKENSKKYKKLNPEKIRDAHLKNRFGIDSNCYDYILKEQDNVCAICNKNNPINEKTGKSKRLAVDHDHNTGIIRGLLCHQCNIALGSFNDNIENLKWAIEYLKLSQVANDCLQEIQNAS